MADVVVYPLKWPVGQIRTPVGRRGRARFYSGSDSLSFSAALGRCKAQIQKLHATELVVTTDIKARQDGLPFSKARMPDDPGVAVYFRVRGEPHCIACDRWDRLADNLGAIAATINALRGIERWGALSMKQAFAGARALPAMEAKRAWWEILGFAAPPDDRSVVDEKYQARMQEAHPDKGGNHNQAAELNAAYAEAKAFYTAVGV